MTKIIKISGSEVLDSRGYPTVKASLFLQNGVKGEAIVPSGASTGENEALELRDHDPKRYHGKGVKKAISNIEHIIAPSLLGTNIDDVRALDKIMIDLDGTSNKSKLGANAILAVSLAAYKAKALHEGLHLYELFLKMFKIAPSLPMPLVNILNGGVHASNNLDFQEFMIIPQGLTSISDRIRASSEIFHTLKKLLSEKSMGTLVGDEGGFAPHCESNEEALNLLMMAIERAGYKPGDDIFLALDVAASFIYKGSGRYFTHKKQGKPETISREELITYYEKLIKSYPIISIEDGLGESDWEGWKLLTKRLGHKIQIVGDDLFVTNIHFLKRGIEEESANAILIKPNQIGTMSETLDTIQEAKKHHFNFIISHRSGETEDTTISDLAVGTGAPYIKAGSVSRSERTCKYNRLMEIESWF